MIQGIHHIAIIASSEKSVAFYEELGFQESFRKVRAYDTVVLMEGHGMELEIFIDPKHPARATNPENLGVRHIAFRVDDLEEMVEVFDCQPIMTDWKGIRYTYTSDPDGLPIEFHE